MIVFRITRSLYANDLSGRGAEKAGGRWNHKGNPVLYTCQSRALAAMELAVHITLSTIRNDFVMLSIEIPDTNVYVLPNEKLPDDWKQYPFPISTQSIGTKWLAENNELVMMVPSVVIEGEYNFLINPLHNLFSEVKIIEMKDFAFDTRLQQHS